MSDADPFGLDKFKSTIRSIEPQFGPATAMGLDREIEGDEMILRSLKVRVSLQWAWVHGPKHISVDVEYKRADEDSSLYASSLSFNGNPDADVPVGKIVVALHLADQAVEAWCLEQSRTATVSSVRGAFESMARDSETTVEIYDSLLDVEVDE